MESLLIVVIVLLAIVLMAVVLAFFRRPQAADLSTPLQNLTQAVQQGHSQTAVLAERISGLMEKVSRVEQDQASTAVALRQDLSRARENLTELQTHAKARQELELRTAESIRRLEAIIAGSQSKGAAGENLLEIVFAKLPAEWQVRGFRVGDKTVEFGLRLPNNLVLPIDSKWPATNLLEQFAGCDDPTEQQKLKAQIHQTVLDKAKEVKKYIDPNVTVNFAIAAVPDAVYDLCGGIQAEVFQFNVVLISYSLFIPYLLLVFQSILKTAHNIDLQKLEAYLQSAQESIRILQEELEGRFSKSLTMLNNSRGDMSAQLSKLSGGLTSLQIGAGGSPLPGELPALSKGETVGRV